MATLARIRLDPLQGCQASLEKKSQTMSEKKPNRVKKAKLLNKREI